MPQPGAWGFQQQQPPMPPPMQQSFLGNQGIMPPMMGNNMFQNQQPAFLQTQANLIQQQQAFPRFRPAPPPLPPQPPSGPNTFNLNINRPPPPPPVAVPRPPININGVFNNQDNTANRNQSEQRSGNWYYNAGQNRGNQFNMASDQTARKDPPQSQPNQSNQNLSDQEQQFDIMFVAWEEGFDSWKRENQNNPDQVLFNNLKMKGFKTLTVT